MAVAVSLRFQVVDSKGKSSFTKIRIPTGLTIPQYIEAGQAFGQLITNMQAGSITSVSATFAIDLSALGLKAAANSLADVAQKGYFAFSSAATKFFKRLRIPTFNEGLVAVGSDAIDTSDPAVAAFATAMTNGIVTAGGTIQPTTDRVQDLVALTDAREQFRKHNL